MRIVFYFFIVISLTGCYVYDNSVDPDAKSFSGYNTVDSLSKISPEGSDLLDKALLISSKYKGQCKYEFQVKLSEVESWEGISINISDTNIIDAGFLNLVSGLSYDWRVRGVFDNNTGEWSGVKTFKTVSNLKESSRSEGSSWYLADFIYLKVGGVSWGKSWEVRYKVDDRDYVIVDSENNTLSINDIGASNSIKYQIREKDQIVSGFWSEEVELVKAPLGLKFSNIISDQVELTVGSGNEDQDTPDTKVNISNGFAIGQYEVTYNEYVSVVNECLERNIGSLELKSDGLYRGADLLLFIVEPLSVIEGKISLLDSKKNYPVVNVTWIGASVLPELLNSLEGWKEGFGYRLPTEIEWEYVVSGGGKTVYSWGDEFVNTELNYSSAGSKPVGSYSPSLEFNCYDLLGNVWEWCLDSYSIFKYNFEQSVDLKNIRGGSWKDLSESVFNRSHRYYLNKNEYKDSIGIRLVFLYGN